MPPANQDHGSWGTRSFYLMLLITQTVGVSVSTDVPNSALHHGALGYLIVYMLLFILLGIPLLYMELIIGQFTGLNSIEVWKVRPFLSHFGYVMIFWQLMILLYNHTAASFTFHYFLISFENPIPYYTCGRWKTKDCGIIRTNYTVNQDCLRNSYPYCVNLHTTYPEFQYWRQVVLNMNIEKNNPKTIVSKRTISWRVCLPSSIACTLLFLSCFKRKQSMKWFLGAFIVYPTVAYFLLMMGSMLQKGIVMNFQEALDLDWKVFSESFRFPPVVEQVIYCLGVGTGLGVNLGASSAFRAPCYANAAMAAVAGAAFALLTICTTAMMACPYAYQYDVSPYFILSTSMTLTFERIPRMLREYEYSFFWNIIVFSCHACLALRTDALILFNILEAVAAKYPRVAKYPGIFTFGAVIALFCISLPFLSPLMTVLQTSSYRRCVKLFGVFFVLSECLVFILWYGIDRFCEDVHFMQGIRPRAFMKTAWIVATIMLTYVFFKELYLNVPSTILSTDALGFILLVLMLGILVASILVRLLVGAFKKQLGTLVGLQGGAWRPRGEVLQRSRAMFSAQAMTKEYLYRQYHLQAGILARQHRANAARHSTM